MSDLRPLITVQQLMEIWGSKESSIYDLLRRKVNPLPGHKLGKAWRIDPQQAAEWLEDEQSRRVA